MELSGRELIEKAGEWFDRQWLADQEFVPYIKDRLFGEPDQPYEQFLERKKAMTMAYGLDIDEVFAFHPATPDTGPKHDSVREKCRELAHWLDENVPQSPEATTAIRKLQETMMFANAAIAIHTPRE